MSAVPPGSASVEFAAAHGVDERDRGDGTSTVRGGAALQRAADAVARAAGALERRVDPSCRSARRG
jgi:hypothetical protein